MQPTMQVKAKYSQARQAAILSGRFQDYHFGEFFRIVRMKNQEGSPKLFSSCSLPGCVYIFACIEKDASFQTSLPSLPSAASVITHALEKPVATCSEWSTPSGSLGEDHESIVK